MDNNYYPVFLQLANKRCLVVGGGDVATRKAASLQECGAAVCVVSPAVTPALQEMAAGGGLEIILRPFAVEDVHDAALVIAATNQPEVNRAVARACRERQIPVNVVDAPQESSFIVPAAIRRGPLTLAVSTGGTLPAMARKIRQDLENQFDEAYGELLTVLGETRTRVLAEIPDPAARRRIFTALAAADLLTVLRTHGPEALRQNIEQIIALQR
jgi:precorrin-2 dehydrogenase / sirohydrochlorin ferrochelatase